MARHVYWSLGLFFLANCSSNNAPEIVVPPPELPQVEAESLVLSILEPELLNRLESELGLHAVLGTASTTLGQHSTAWMNTNVPRWVQLTEHLGSRIEAVASEVQRDLVVEHKDALAWPAGNVGRRLDPRWLNSQIAFSELVGIVNRMDRRDFIPENPCGEVRLIYRLAYRVENESGNTVSSRLPVTFNVVMSPLCTDGAQIAARRWEIPEHNTVEERALHLLDGPLNLAQLRFKQIEVNAQVVRFPSGLETEFAGQAMYLLRVYGFDENNEIDERPLENTPDVLRLQQDPALKDALLEWIRNNLQAIDEGVYQVPSSFLAHEALSWSTLGINRWANKPFDALFPKSDRGALPTPDSTTQWVASPAALIDRLNNGSCVGCHQASTTAGFHMLGQDDPEISGVTNRLQLPFSAHFQAEQSRRRLHLAAIANGHETDRFRPHSLLTGQAEAHTNGNCIPESYRADFRTTGGLTCSAEQTCEIVASDPSVGIQFGQCMPTSAALKSGNTCRMGEITPTLEQRDGLFNLHAYADRFTQTQRYDLPENMRFAVDSYNCRPPRIGVPLGRTFRQCTPEERQLDGLTGEDVQEEFCAVVGGSRFDSCVERDFHSCLEEVVGRGMVSSCHLGHFCREDYICQLLPYQLNGVPTEAGQAVVDAGVGFCTPTYFMFQLRLDGHPVPDI